MLSEYGRSMTNLTFQSLLAETVSVLKANFNAFFTICSFLSVLTTLVMVAFGYSNLVLGTISEEDILTFPGGPIGLLTVVGLYHFFPYALSFGVVALAVVRYMEGNPATLGACIMETMPQIGMLFLGGIVYWLLILVGLNLLVLPGLYAMVIWYMIWPIIVVEKTGLKDAFSRSNALSKGARLPILGVALFIALTQVMVAVLMMTVLTEGIVWGVVSAVIRGAFIAVSAVSAAVAYQMLKQQHG